ncbi:MAG TPA: glycosyltransferase family 2 protein [Candidatus Paceibacterota bacterium]|nr:glycosyltransferase family 2 protein [Candidatus Paceibacterota bacterium]
MKRFFEILPGILAWLTLIFMVLFSWLLPVWVSIFIILFDIYWVLKTVYLSLHLRATFSEMRRVMKVDWLARIREELPAASVASGLTPGASPTPAFNDIYHLVILPMYDEPYEVVSESFESLKRANYPKEKMLVVLALEDGAGDTARETGKKLQNEYGAAFGKFLVTHHPAGLPDEIPGKGSNEVWAGMQAKREIIDLPTSTHPGGIPPEHVLVSVFDIDTQVFPEYFSRLTYVFLKTEKRLRAIYQPIPLFTNNVYEAPMLARVVAFSTTFWQMMQQSRPERLTSFSSQSIPLQTLLDIGWWQKDIVSEDSRIFWQGYFAYHGDFHVEPLFYPVSMDVNVAPTFWATMKNIYKQQRRWGWGVENIPYMMEGFRNDPQIPAAKKRYWTFNVIEGFHSWATNSLIIFALGWLPLALGGRHFGHSILSYDLPHITRFIVSLSMVGVASSAVLSVMLLPKPPGGLTVKDYSIFILQWVLMPFTLIIFGAFPGLEAQTRLMLGGKYRLGFWVTPKGRYS